MKVKGYSAVIHRCQGLSFIATGNVLNISNAQRAVMVRGCWSLMRKQSCLERNQGDSLGKSMRGSIKEVIREGSKARRLQDQRQAWRSVDVTAALIINNGGLNEGKRQQKILADLERKQKIEYMKLYPLPLRMPKYAGATATNNDIPFGVRFFR